MTDDEDVMRNVQREKKLNLDLVFFDFHKSISYGTISEGKSMENQWKSTKILEISENQKILNRG